MSSNNNTASYELRSHSPINSSSPSNNNNNNKSRYYSHPLQIAMQDHSTGAQILNSSQTQIRETRQTTRMIQTGYNLRN